MRQHQVRSNGIELHVADIGEGSPVLFRHGFPAIAASWRARMETVAAAGYRAIASSRLGYESSGWRTASTRPWQTTARP